MARLEHLARFDVDSVPQRIGEIVQALQILASSSLIGRGSSAYAGLYRFVEDIDVVLVLAIRGQRESG